MFSRRRFIATVGLLPFAARAQGIETARIIIGFPPGGTTDVMGRKVAEKLRGPYARSVIVDNRPGAGGQLGVTVLRDSPADGSVMLLTPSSMLTIYPFTFPKLNYRIDEVQPVSLAMYTHHVLSVGPAVPDSVKNLKDFFAWTKANPDKAVYGSPGAGSMPHLIGVLISKASGAELRHVAYRGSAPGIQDLLGGQIASFLGPVGDVLTHSRAGKVRVLGSSGKERDTFLPAVPTMGEQGIAMGLREWYAFFMPAKTSAEVVQRAASALDHAIKQADVVEFGRQFGLEVQASTPRVLADLLKADAAEWSGLARQTGFTADS